MSGLGSPPPPPPAPAPTSRSTATVSRWVILLVLVLVVTGGAFAARLLITSGRHHGPTYPAAWDARILPYAKIAEKQRGLYFKHPVAVRFLTAAKFKKTVTSDKKDLSKKDREELDQTTALLRAFGLIKGDLDLFEAANDFSGSGTLAYYSFEDRNITIRGETVTPAMRSTLVHELTHVLQDQHFGIGAREKKLEKAKDDASSEQGTVLDALVEGDADRMETSYRQSLSRKQRKALDSSKQGEFDEANKTYKKIPKIIITIATSPYTLGEAMVQTAAANGGNSAVDELFRKTPTNESALLDPLRRTAGQDPHHQGRRTEARRRREEDRLRPVRSPHLVLHAGGAPAAARRTDRRGRPRRRRLRLLQASRQRVRARFLRGRDPGRHLPDAVGTATVGRCCAGSTGEGGPRR